MIGCSLEDVRKDAIASIKSEFKGDAKSITFQGMTAIVRYGPQYKVKSRNQAYKMAQSKLHKVEVWGVEHSDEDFRNGWGSIDSSSSDAIHVYLQIPPKFIRAYQIKKSEAFERDISFFMGDEALMEQEQGIMYQRTNRSSEAVNERLNSFLEGFLKQYGISVNYVESFQNRKEMDSIATADILNKVITVAKNRADITTLPEEAAHFIVEMMDSNQTLFKAMKKLALQTQTYQDVSDSYSSIYNGNQDMIAKEAMGKLLSDYIVKRSKSTGDLSINNQNLLDRILKWIKSFFGKIDNNGLQAELDDVFGQAANDIASGEIELNPDLLARNKRVYQQQSNLAAKLSTTINRLEKRARILEEQARNQADENKALSLKMAADRIRKQLENNYTSEAIRTYLHSINVEEFDTLLKDIEKFKNDPDSVNFSSSKINRMFEVVELHETNLTDLGTILRWNEEYKDLYREHKDMLDLSTTKLATIKQDAEKIFSDRATRLVHEYKAEGSEYSASELINSSVGDTGFLQRWFGPLYAAKDEILRMVYKVVGDVYNNTHRETVQIGKEMLNAQIDLEKAGYKPSDLHDRDENGNKTGYLLTQYKWAEYYREKDKMKERITKRLNKELYSDVLEANLTNEEQRIVQEERDKFYSKYHKISNGKSIATPPRNPRYDELIQNKAFAAYYELVKSAHTKSRINLPKKLRRGRYQWMLPQIRKDIMQTLKNSENPLFKEIGSRIKENFYLTEEDIDYGSQQEVLKDINGKVVKRVPIHYTRPLDKPHQISDDITSMYSAFYEMSENFRGLSEKVDDLEVIQRAMGKRKVQPGRLAFNEGTKLGFETNSFKALEDFIDAFIYGQEKKKQYLHLPNGKRIEMSKPVDQFRNMIRSKNLFLNLPITISSYVKGAMDSKLEDVVGTISTQESKNFAEKEFDRNLPYMFANINRRRKSTKLEALYEYFGVASSTNEMFKRLDMTDRASRTTSSDIIYSTYTLADFRIRGKLALAIMDNLRLVDGRYVTKAQFQRNYTGKKKWSDFQKDSLYNAYEYKDYKLQVKPEYRQHVTKATENKMMNIMNQRGGIITGMPGKLDRSGIYRGMFGRMVMLHRGWLVAGATERFRPKGINYQTEEFEEGYYRTVGRAVANTVFNTKPIKARLATWSNLSEYEKRNVKKFMVDMAFVLAARALSAVFNNIADDDEEDKWVNDYMAYQTNRILLEQEAFVNPKEIPSILNSPSAAISTVEDMQSIFYSVFSDREIEYGAYEGLNHKERILIRNSIIKNIWELPHVKDKNKFIKTQIL